MPAPSNSDTAEGVFESDGKFVSVVVYKLADQKVKVAKEFDSRKAAEKWLQAARQSESKLTGAWKQLDKDVEESSKLLESYEAVKDKNDIGDIQAGQL